jgi:hypothetical protein
MSRRIGQPLSCHGRRLKTCRSRQGRPKYLAARLIGTQAKPRPPAARPKPSAGALTRPIPMLIPPAELRRKDDRAATGQAQEP